MDAGAVYVYVRDPMTLEWTPQPTYVKASNTDAGDEFGWSVGLSADGNTLAVGAPFEDSSAVVIDGPFNNSATDAGAVYVYVRDPITLEWAPQPTYIKASNTDAGDLFGSSVGLSADGNTLAVGAPYEDGSATGIGGDPLDNSAGNAGGVYVYVRDPMFLEWDPQPIYVKASNTGSGHRFGRSVGLSVDGNTLAVGAPYEHGSSTGIGGDPLDNSAGNAGAVYVYVRDPMTLEWSPQPIYVKASNTDEDDAFGWIVGLSADGHTLAVGAPFENGNATGIGGDPLDNSASGAGAVYIY